LTIEEPVVKEYNKKAIDTVSKVLIECLLDAKVNVTGAVTGQQYVFHGAGSKALVDVLDKDEILNKRKGRSCCGGQSNGILFQLANSE
jgi:hypothetical protein